MIDHDISWLETMMDHDVFTVIDYDLDTIKYTKTASCLYLLQNITSS